jgi:hypothetical protein
MTSMGMVMEKRRTGRTRDILSAVLESTGQLPFRASWSRNPDVPRAGSLFALSGSAERIGTFTALKQPPGHKLLIETRVRSRKSCS